MRYGWLILLALLLGGCVVPAPKEPTTLTKVGEESVWREEYAFRHPPAPWALYDMNEEDVSLAFVRWDGNFTGQVAISYAEEPFGYSRELKPRATEFLKRYLWAARVQFETPTFVETSWNGKPALEMQVVGHEPVKKSKVRGRVFFVYRGERIVAFIFTQWEEEGRPFSDIHGPVFDAFIQSFRYLKPSFYQRLGIGR